MNWQSDLVCLILSWNTGLLLVGYMNCRLSQLSLTGFESSTPNSYRSLTTQVTKELSAYMSPSVAKTLRLAAKGYTKFLKKIPAEHDKRLCPIDIISAILLCEPLNAHFPVGFFPLDKFTNNSQVLFWFNASLLSEDRIMKLSHDYTSPKLYSEDMWLKVLVRIHKQMPFIMIS